MSASAPASLPPPAGSNSFTADCKASEVREFTAEFLEKALEPSGWRAVWRTSAFEVLVEVRRLSLADSCPSNRHSLGAYF